MLRIKRRTIKNFQGGMICDECLKIMEKGIILESASNPYRFIKVCNDCISKVRKEVRKV